MLYDNKYLYVLDKTLNCIRGVWLDNWKVLLYTRSLDQTFWTFVFISINNKYSVWQPWLMTNSRLIMSKPFWFYTKCVPHAFMITMSQLFFILLSLAHFTQNRDMVFIIFKCSECESKETQTSMVWTTVVCKTFFLLLPK